MRAGRSDLRDRYARDRSGRTLCCCAVKRGGPRPERRPFQPFPPADPGLPPPEPEHEIADEGEHPQPNREGNEDRVEWILVDAGGATSRPPVTWLPDGRPPSRSAGCPCRRETRMSCRRLP